MNRKQRERQRQRIEQAIKERRRRPGDSGGLTIRHQLLLVLAIFALLVAGRYFLGPVCHNIIGQPIHSRACEEYRASQGLR